MTSIVKRMFTKRYGGLKIHVSARFDTDNAQDPTRAQIVAFLNSKGVNVVRKQGMKVSIRPNDLKKSPYKTWLDGIVYELTGVKFGKIVKAPKVTSEARLEFTFVLDIDKLKNHFYTDEVREALADEMSIRAEHSVSQEVFFHYFTKGEYATAYLTGIRTKISGVDS